MLLRGRLQRGLHRRTVELLSEETQVVADAGEMLLQGGDLTGQHVHESRIYRGSGHTSIVLAGADRGNTGNYSSPTPFYSAEGAVPTRTCA